MAKQNRYPEWLKAQRRLTWKSEVTKVRKTYKNKFKIVKEFANELAGAHERITHRDIRRMLESLDRGYTTDAQSISRLLHGGRGSRNFEKYANGHRVQVADSNGVRMYNSLNAAAKHEGCSPESVRKWAASKRPNRRGEVWGFVDPPSRRSKRRRKH